LWRDEKPNGSKRGTYIYFTKYLVVIYGVLYVILLCYQQVAVFSRTWRAPARHMFTWLESFYEKDMPNRPLHASPSIHSCEIIFGETTAEKCAN
jgi:hypothetical protein